jgi:hypothetical protein
LPGEGLVSGRFHLGRLSNPQFHDRGLSTTILTDDSRTVLLGWKVILLMAGALVPDM